MNLGQLASRARVSEFKSEAVCSRCMQREGPMPTASLTHPFRAQAATETGGRGTVGIIQSGHHRTLADPGPWQPRVHFTAVNDLASGPGAQIKTGSTEIHLKEQRLTTSDFG